MQKLDNQIWKSRISISTKLLKLYNTCILPIFLYGSECWAVTKRDVLKIDALNQNGIAKAVRNQMVPSRAEWCGEMAIKQPQLPSMVFLHVRPHCVNARWHRTDAKKIWIVSPLETQRRRGWRLSSKT